jgi:hypothetical protein
LNRSWAQGTFTVQESNRWRKYAWLEQHIKSNNWHLVVVLHIFLKKITTLPLTWSYLMLNTTFTGIGIPRQPSIIFKQFENVLSIMLP